MLATLPRRTPVLAWLLPIFCLLGLGAGQTPAQDVVVDRNVVYYDGPEFYAPRHILDVYRLDDGKVRPVLMFIHGHQIAASVAHWRSQGDFGPEVVGKCYSKDRAVFSVRRPPSGSWGNIGPL